MYVLNKIKVLLQEERFFFSKYFFELHWVLPYDALNSEFANFETPCILKCKKIIEGTEPKGPQNFYFLLSFL
jgi:hypothetical protein